VQVLTLAVPKFFINVSGQNGFSVFGTTTSDFHLAADMLLEKKVEHVAMEATGVYWMGLYDIFESRGLKVTLVKAGDAKNLPGRDKTDGEDCQWICNLFSHGLLRPSVIPAEQIRQLRVYMRLRDDHIGLSAQHKQHIQKAFIMMNIRLPETISDITGTSGRKMIEAILQGERDPEQIALLCHSTIRNKKSEQLLKALQGIYKDEYLL
jgi:transposase